jgi:hypothetical protein
MTVPMKIWRRQVGDADYAVIAARVAASLGKS